MEQLIFYYTGTMGSFTLDSGRYLFECWGAGSVGAYGGYARGEIYLESRTVFYYCVGSSIEIFNGNAYSRGIRYRSGGATDIRLIGGGVWNDVASLRSRIMVAGGAGSPGAAANIGGHGGGIIGKDMTGGVGAGGYGATQTSGGVNGGVFGQGGTGNSGNGGHGGSGGGGYWGGGGTNVDGSLDDDRGGGGGSGFVSGMPGCVAVTSSGANSGSPVHYSGLSFTEAAMQVGENEAITGKIVITALEKQVTGATGVYTKVNGEWVAGTI